MGSHPVVCDALTRVRVTQSAGLRRRCTLDVAVTAGRLPQGICHVLFASRRGLLPAVRVLIDFLAEKMPALLEAARLECIDCDAKAKALAAGT
jgi:hypothetical protein